MYNIIQKQAVYYPAQDKPVIVRYSLFGLINRVCINVMYKDNPQPDDTLHSHPANFLSIILWGKYKEDRLKDGKIVTKIYSPLSVNRMKYSELHKFDLVSDKVITLFFRSNPKRNYATWYNKEWGELHEVKFWNKKKFTKQEIRRIFNSLHNDT
jgi:hypothetical protein